MNKAYFLSSGRYKAFTLVELIVVITILAILWTISFISLQWFSRDARDTKRLSDVRSLYGKISIETIKWASEWDFQEFTHTWLVTIKWKDAIVYYWTVDFTSLKENHDSFVDPISGDDYEYAYTKWEDYSFLQISAKSETNSWELIIAWHYVQFNTGDAVDLFWWSSWGGGNNGDWVTHNPTAWTITISYNWTSYTIKDKNEWATSLADETICQDEFDSTCTQEYLWNYYQWWRNDSWNWTDNTNNANADSWYTWTEWEQWPCEDWYHVPTAPEWIWFLSTWFASKWFTCNQAVWNYCTWSVDDAYSLITFQAELKLPLAGSRGYRFGTLGGKGLSGSYWSSSPSGAYAYSLVFGSSLPPQRSGDFTPRGDGYSIRCFKN